MKRFLCIVLSVIFVIFPVSSLASNNGVNLTFSYDKVSRELTLSGRVGSAEHIPCTVYIFDSVLSSGELSDSNPAIFAEIAITGADGAFNFAKTLSDSFPSGKYKVKVACENSNWITEFMYTKEASVSELLSTINGAASAFEMQQILSSNTNALGIDATIYNNNKNDISNFLFSTKPSGGYGDAPEFISALEQCTVAALLKSGSDASGILLANAGVVSIDFEDDYNKFPARVKAFIDTELKNADYTTGLLSVQYPRLRTVAFVKAAPTWQALKNAFYGVDSQGNTIVSNYSVINPDLTRFNSLSNKDNVFDLMFKRRSELTTVEKIRSVFKSCAEHVYKDENNSASDDKGSNDSFVNKPVSGPVTIDPGYINPIPEPVKPTLFYDTPSTAWYYPSVEKLTSLSLINGYEDKSFKPDNPITRAEYVKLIVGIANHLAIPMVSQENEILFDDVSDSDWYAEIVKAAASAGVVKGNGKTFSPNSNVTRQDAAVILYRLVSKLKKLNGGKEFSDDNDISDYAKEAVSALASANVISGMGNNTFAPNANLTRAQAAKLFSGVLEFLN